MFCVGSAPKALLSSDSRFSDVCLRTGHARFCVFGSLLLFDKYCLHGCGFSVNMTHIQQESYSSFAT